MDKKNKEDMGIGATLLWWLFQIIMAIVSAPFYLLYALLWCCKKLSKLFKKLSEVLDTDEQ